MKTILLAEDNDMDAELTIEAFAENRFGNTINRVRDGVELLQYLNQEGAFSEIRHEQPLLILLDLKMPRMDGLEVLEILKKEEQFKNIPVVMLTSSKAEEDLIKSYNLGVNAFVVKPVDFEDFIAAIRSIGKFWLTINETPA